MFQLLIYKKKIIYRLIPSLLAIIEQIKKSPYLHFQATMIL